MGELSKIEWTHHTFNPWWGCTKVGPGCDHCYAEALDRRTGGAHWGPHAERRRMSDEYWKQPAKWNRKAIKLGYKMRVFCASMADVFDNAVPAQWRIDLAQVIRDTPHLIWMLLTKRIGNASEMLAEMFPEGVPSNVWLGVTIVNQKEADRDIPMLLDIAHREKITVPFLSMEPLLDSVDITEYLQGEVHVRLVIAGGESGPGWRDVETDYFRNLRDQCADAPDTAFFFKQMPGKAPNPGRPANSTATGGSMTPDKFMDWIPHDGSCCPLQVGTEYFHKHRNGQVCHSVIRPLDLKPEVSIGFITFQNPFFWEEPDIWSGDIVAYKIIKLPPEEMEIPPKVAIDEDLFA